MAIGKAGAINAALLAAAILALNDKRVALALDRYRNRQSDSVLSQLDPRSDPTSNTKTRPGTDA
jgi:5-(carboxyamino)imidazole ribonucleotide mutase